MCVPERIGKLLAKYEKGSVTSKEFKDLLTWVFNDPANRSYVEALMEGTKDRHLLSFNSQEEKDAWDQRMAERLKEKIRANGGFPDLSAFE